MTGLTSATRSERVHVQLRGDILRGRYAPGDALPSERRLSEDLGTNRHAIREALKRLQQAGLVSISQGGATRVRDWRRHGGLELLLDLDELPEAIGRGVMGMRARGGAGAGRRAAGRGAAGPRARAQGRGGRR